MVPPGFAALLRDAETPGPRRVAALETLGLAWALVGAYPEQVANDREAVALRPRAPAPRRRLVYGLLRLGRDEEARREAQTLVALDPDDPRSRVFAQAAERPAPAAIDALPLLVSRNPLRQ
jgi:Flp pilus assembly protein TadD